MNTHPVTEAVMRCAVIRESWVEANPRPYRDPLAGGWWSRWMDSDEKRECDRMLREAFSAVSAVPTLGIRETRS